jgi:LYR motif-containing protein 4
MNRIDKLSLYKNILRGAQRFPSIKRDGLVQEIRLNFRQNRALEDEKEIQKCLSIAIKGLSQLSMYTSLKPSASQWSVTLDQQPMPRRPTSE